MFKKIVIFINVLSFFFVQTAFAIQPSELTAYNDFFSQSGLTKHSVKLSELHQKFSKNLPKEIKEQFEAYLKENPEAMVPQMNVQKVGSEIQISVRSATDNFVIQTKKGEQVWGTVVGTYNGKQIKEEISPYAFVEGAQVVYEARVEQEMLNPKFMTAKEIKKLSKNEQARYFRMIQNLLAAAEAMQNSNAAVNETASIFQLFIENAWALQGDCVIAGYIGNYSGTSKCKFPKSGIQKGGSCSQGQSQCNPMVYGHNVCIGSDDMVSITATKECNEAGKVINVVPVLESIHDEASFNKELSSIKKRIKSLNNKCSTDVLPKYSQNKIPKDQGETCLQLQKRIREINKLQCSDYEKHVTSFQCQPGNKPKEVSGSSSASLPECPATSDSSATGVDGGSGTSSNTDDGGSAVAACVPPSSSSKETATSKSTSPTAKGGNDGVDGSKSSSSDEVAKKDPKMFDQLSGEEAKRRMADCEELNKVQGSLKCGKNSTVKQLSCRVSEEGKTVSKALNYCYCHNPEDARGNGQISPQYSIECASGSLKSSTTKSTGSSKGGFTKSDFYSGFMKALPFLIGGGLMYLVYTAQKTQVDNYYKQYKQMIQTINPPVPPPTTGSPTFPLGSPPTGGVR